MIKYVLIIFIFFYSSHLFGQDSIIEEQVKKHNEHLSYWTKLTAKPINRVDEQGSKQGQWLFFYPNGEIKEIHSYKDDKLDGCFSSFYQASNMYDVDVYNSLKEQIFYKNGFKHGRRIQLSPLGELVLKCYYEHDTLERKYSKYEQGSLNYYCFYEKGKIHGELRFISSYNEYTKEANSMVYYTHGRKDSSLFFYETGETKHRFMYENNKILWSHTYDKKGSFMWAEYYDNDRVYKIEQYQRDFKKEQDIKNDKFFRKYYKDTLSLIWIKHYKEE